MSNGNNSIPLGDVQFLDNYVPPLEADDYTISVAQTVTSSDPAQPLNESFKVTQDFSVVAPRFALPAADVQSVFPPANASGSFDQNLPHVVLTERALPWERLINESDAGTKGTPWMALLLFTEDEIIPPLGTTDNSVLTNPTLTGTYPVSAGTTSADSLLKPTDPHTLGPQITPNTTDETTCNAIDITTETFARVVPRHTELPFLAHVRDVNAALEHKATDVATSNGWFSVVIGNRFPAAPAGDGPSNSGMRNIAHLVSLEGFDKYLVEKALWPSGITKVRLASLQSWSFTCVAETGNFATLMNNLVSGPIKTLNLTKHGSGYTSDPDVQLKGGGGSGAVVVAKISEGSVSELVIVDGGSGYTSPPAVSFAGGGGSGAAAQAILESQGGDTLRLRLPVNSKAQKPQTPAAYVQTALQRGYAALAYDTRVGDHTFGWYHGPLVPDPITPFSEAKLFQSPAAATVYDQDTGTFDLSYAAAWEIGRLLALADSGRATHRMRAAKALRKVVNLLRERTRLSSGQKLLASNDALEDLLEPKYVSRSFVSWLGGDAAERLPKPGVKVSHVQQQAPTVGGAERVHAVAHLRSLHERPEVQGVINNYVNGALAEAPLADLVNALGGLRLLKGVPFAHLIPDARMLPPESIRFFYVDPNYLDALADGASSLGIHTSRDATQRSLTRGVLRTAAIRHAHKLRAYEINRPNLLQDAEAADPIAGLLLRSAVVSGWPGLEVKAYQNIVPNSNPLEPDVNTLIQPVRMDRLAPDVLLCLYSKVPAWIEFDEPKEGLAFGVEDPQQTGGPPQVALRYLDDTGGHMGQTTGKSVPLSSSDLRAATSRVINVDKWQAYLSQQVPASSTKWGPAAFAIQMVRAPEKMIFQNQLNPAPKETQHGR